jgi:VanZ family protein
MAAVNGGAQGQGTDVPRRGRSAPRVMLAVYALLLVLVAVWPGPVDAPVDPLLSRITHRLPWLTYARMEFGANVLLFVPLGLLLAVVLSRRHLILPIAIVTTVAIESFQALLLVQRTPSVMDIVANTTGACVGLLIVAAVEWSGRRHSSA